MTTTPDILPPEGATAGEQLVAAGATLVKVTNDSMLAVSQAHPRKIEEVKQRVLNEIELVPELAVRGFYDLEKGGDRIVGASVYLTRLVARNFGNCTVRTYLSSADSGIYQLAGVFIDLETNYRCERIVPVSAMAWRKGPGKYVEQYGESLMNLLQIGASKAERAAVTNGVPDWLLQTAFRRCQELAAKDERTKLGATIKWFSDGGVTREALERHIGQDLGNLDEVGLAAVRGLANAWRDHEIEAKQIGVKPEGQDAEETVSTIDEVLSGGEAQTTGGIDQPDEPAKTNGSKSRTVADVKPKVEAETLPTIDRTPLPDEGADAQGEF